MFRQGQRVKFVQVANRWRDTKDAIRDHRLELGKEYIISDVFEDDEYGPSVTLIYNNSDGYEDTWSLGVEAVEAIGIKRNLPDWF